MPSSPTNRREKSDHLLQSLTAEARRAILHQSLEKTYRTGEVLWSAGDKSEGITLVLEGKIRIVRGTDGRQTVIHSSEIGATLGEVPFFSAGAYPATAIASEPARCLFIPHAAVARAIAIDPAVAFFFLRRLSLRVQELVGKLEQNTVHSVQTRLARFILDRYLTAAARSSSRGEKDRVTVSLGMTQLALAEELGTVREVLVRALRVLRDAKAIDPVGAGRYRIDDASILELIASPSTAPPQGS